ncbi:Hypothetical protein CINCED_3A014613 [Cinara cedri]|uniref:THAP-type domain-containing protein n=1 Tax=Cinara cedri TaxID=506608 RepID=A0A5E4MT95_9HEMI|nr:Hypothetical protein CINCED_3A014613 [Cinara cedri]
MNCDTAKNLWEKLLSVYEQKSETSVTLIQQKFYRYSMNPNDNIAQHISKLESEIKTASAWDSMLYKAKTLLNLSLRLMVKEARKLQGQEVHNKTESSFSCVSTSKSPTRFRSRINYCKRKNFNPGKGAKICSKHFKLKDYNQSHLLRQQLMPNIKVKVKLNGNVVPTVPQNIPSTSNLSERKKNIKPSFWSFENNKYKSSDVDDVEDDNLVVITSESFGAILAVQTICENGHIFKWISQSLSGKRVVGNILIEAALTLSDDQHRQNNINKLKMDRSIWLAGDSQFDSLGFCAKYCTYSVMDGRSSKIIDFKITQKEMIDTREFVVIFEHLYPDIEHKFDVWHLSKSLSKRLRTLEKNHHSAFMWKTSIINHLWRSSQMCNDNGTELKKKCEHDPLTDKEIKKKLWIPKNNDSYFALNKIVTNKDLLKNVFHAKHFIHTGRLESYQNIRLKYNMPKSIHLKCEGMYIRSIIAILDHNNNTDKKIIEDKMVYSKTEVVTQLIFHIEGKTRSLNKRQKSSHKGKLIADLMLYKSIPESPLRPIYFTSFNLLRPVSISEMLTLQLLGRSCCKNGISNVTLLGDVYMKLKWAANKLETIIEPAHYLALYKRIATELLSVL